MHVIACLAAAEYKKLRSSSPPTSTVNSETNLPQCQSRCGWQIDSYKSGHHLNILPPCNQEHHFSSRGSSTRPTRPTQHRTLRINHRPSRRPSWVSRPSSVCAPQHAAFGEDSSEMRYGIGALIFYRYERFVGMRFFVSALINLCSTCMRW